MEISRIISDLKEYYDENIKPALDDNAFELAGIQMQNLLMGCIDPYINQIRSYHSGTLFVASARLLESRLWEAEEIPESAIKRFKAYLTQLELSTKSGNVFH